MKFRMPVPQALHGLSLAQTAYLVSDRLNWMRFCGLDPGDRVPDAKTLRDFCEAQIAAPFQRNTDAERAAVKAAGEVRSEKPAKAPQTAIEARWTVKFAKDKPDADSMTQTDIAIPLLGDKFHISIDRSHSVVRYSKATDAAVHDSVRLREE